MRIPNERIYNKQRQVIDKHGVKMTDFFLNNAQHVGCKINILSTQQWSKINQSSGPSFKQYNDKGIKFGFELSTFILFVVTQDDK